MDFAKAIIKQIEDDVKEEPRSYGDQIRDDIRRGMTDEEIKKKYPSRGGARPGAGRKPIKSALKKQKKSFSLSPETVHALNDLEQSLGLSSQSAVVEFLALRGLKIINEKQLDLF